MSAVSHLMTTSAPGQGRRNKVPWPVASSEPVEQLDRAVDALHRVNRTLSRTVLGREELIALGGLLTQISGALLTLTDLLSAPTYHCDRTRLLRAGTDATATERPPSAISLLQECRDGFQAASTSARTFHAHLKQQPPPRAHRSNGEGNRKNKP